MLSIERQNTRTWLTINAGLRMAILRGATRPWANNVIVNEYPKSGGTWMSQMLSAALDLPYPRNRLPMARSCLMQCHALNPIGMRNVVLVWRDGRDVMVSFYHHLLNGHDFANPDFGPSNCRKLGITDVRDVTGNMPIFIEALFTGKIGPRYSWADFVHTWYNRPNTIQTRYEDLLANASTELGRVVHSLTGGHIADSRITTVVEQFSFKSQAGRQRGESKTGKFLRKGIAGDWKNVFSSEATETFNHYAGDALEALGYSDSAE